MRVMPQLLMVKTSSRGDGIHHLSIMAGIGLYAPDIKIDWLV
jgi:ADP-heptose:LPS heptosyltransferase